MCARSPCPARADRPNSVVPFETSPKSRNSFDTRERVTDPASSRSGRSHSRNGVSSLPAAVHAVRTEVLSSENTASIAAVSKPTRSSVRSMPRTVAYKRRSMMRTSPAVSAMRMIAPASSSDRTSPAARSFSSALSSPPAALIAIGSSATHSMRSRIPMRL